MSPEYLISYGSAGILGRFVSREATNAFTRGDRVAIRSERGLEIGTILREIDAFCLPASLRHLPGEILRIACAKDESDAKLRSHLALKAFTAVGAHIEKSAAPVELVDVEVVDEPLTYIIHILRFQETSLETLRNSMAQALHGGVIVHDITNPPALEGPNDCGSCGSGGCGSTGGCKNGTCGSGCGSKREFPDQWKAYFAELRSKMETVAAQS